VNQPGPQWPTGDRGWEEGSGSSREGNSSDAPSSAGSEDSVEGGGGLEGRTEGGAPAVSPLRRSGFAYMRTLEVRKRKQSHFFFLFSPD